MANYTGIPCAHCGKPFQEGDDIVVCPECGAPHHRACYQELGHCALQERHGTGSDWQDPTVRTPKPAENRICGHCGGVNPPQGVFCQFCGSKLDDVEKEGHPAQTESGSTYARPTEQPMGRAMGSEESAMPTPVGPVTPDETFDGVTAREIAAYVGRNSRYYLTVFKVMKESGRKYSFNWSSFLFNFCFFFYRKMWKPALLLVGAMVLLFLPKLPYTMELSKYYVSVYMNMPVHYDMALLQSMGGLMQMINLFQFALMITMGVFGNRIYYNHVIRSIRKAKEQAPAQPEQRVWITLLQKLGGVSPVAGYGAAVAAFVALSAVSYQIALRLIK